MLTSYFPCPQLLEQSLVIEEQMRKAVRTHGKFEGLPTIAGNRDR